MQAAKIQRMREALLVKAEAKTTKKARTKRTAEGGKAMSYQAVMEELSRLCRAVGIPKIATDDSPEVALYEDRKSTEMKTLKILGVKLS